MSKFNNIIAALALSTAPALMATAPAVAQTATEQTEETPAPSDQASPAANDLAIGVPEDSAPKPGETYVSETFGDWAMRCIVLEDGEDPCQMYQLLEDPNGQPIAEFTLFRLPEGGEAAAGATIVVPLETSLQQQLTIKVDNNPAKRYPYAFCNQVGCYARIGLTAEDIASYKRGAEAVLSLVPAMAPDQRIISVKLSLTGFTAAFDQASELDQ